MYRLEHIDFSNVMDISLSEPLPDEIDREDQMLEAKFASSPARDVEKAIFEAP